ncbi:MAG: hypothetical protein DRN04_13780 [Thermoprotei archaeon]|nr:MAG: hypothetical protein DRN04_13780 [Thermoprotei archaeon]
MLVPPSPEQKLRAGLKYLLDFSRRAKELVEKISVENLLEEGGINPYIVASLGLKDLKEVVRLFVYRRVERSLGTSFGNVIEKVFRAFAGGISGKQAKKLYGQWIEWWDVVVPQEKIVISIKSGPADMDADQVRYFAQKAREAEGHGFRPLLVITYGKAAFSVIESTLRAEKLPPEKYLRVGREAIKELLGSEDYYIKLIEELRKKTGGVDIFELIEKKVDELVDELKKRGFNTVEDILLGVT